MTVSTTASTVTYEGNAAATVWSFSFKVPTTSDIAVVLIDADDEETTLSPSQYSLTGIGVDGGGTVTYPLDGAPLAAGAFIRIERVVPLTQVLDLTSQGAWNPEAVEDAFDRVTMQIQQVRAELGITGGADSPSVGAMLRTNNLADLADAPTARTNLGIGSVDNTADADKPVSGPQQDALDLKVNIAGLSSTVLTALTSAGYSVLTTADLVELYARLDELDDGVAPGVLTILGTPPADATVGEAYSFTPTVLNATGSVVFSMTGTLPAGLSLNTATGEISGTPSAPTTATALNITVMDSTEATDSLDAFFLIAVAPISDPTRPSPIPGSWTQRLRRDWVTLGGISLNHGQSEAGIVADAGEYKMGTARYRQGGALGGIYTEAGCPGFGYDAFIDALATDLLPAEYLIERPLGEVEPIPGEGIRIYTRPSTGAEMTALLDAQFGDVNGAAAAGTDLWCSGLLTTFIKGSAKPPFARFTKFRLHFGYEDNCFAAAQWSTEDGNRAWTPGGADTAHLPFEYDCQEVIDDLGESATSMHAYGAAGGVALSARVGNYNPGSSIIGVDVVVLTVFQTDRVATYYTLDEETWTKVGEVLVSAMQTGTQVAEYLQRQTNFIHDISAGFPWLGAPGVPTEPLYLDIKETGIYAPAVNTDITVPEEDPPEEVTLAWIGSYGTTPAAETLPAATDVADLTIPADVVTVNVLGYGARFEADVGDAKLRIAAAGLDYEGQPTVRFALEGVKASGAKLVGRIYEFPVADVAEPDWWDPNALMQVQYPQNRAYLAGVGEVAISAIHDSNNLLTTAAAAVMNGAAWVSIQKGSGNPNNDGLLGNASDKFMAFWKMSDTPKSVTIKVGAMLADETADVHGMSTGSEAFTALISAGTGGFLACATTGGEPTEVAETTTTKTAAATGWYAWGTGWSDEKFNVQAEADTTAGVRTEWLVIAPEHVGGTSAARLTAARARAVVAGTPYYVASGQVTGTFDPVAVGAQVGDLVILSTPDGTFPGVPAGWTNHGGPSWSAPGDPNTSTLVGALASTSTISLTGAGAVFYAVYRGVAAIVRVATTNFINPTTWNATFAAPHASAVGAAAISFQAANVDPTPSTGWTDRDFEWSGTYGMALLDREPAQAAGAQDIAAGYTNTTAAWFQVFELRSA